VNVVSANSAGLDEVSGFLQRNWDSPNDKGGQGLVLRILTLTLWYIYIYIW